MLGKAGGKTERRAASGWCFSSCVEIKDPCSWQAPDLMLVIYP